MGGDGGVIASNRRYMRGAGVADHTADSKRDGQNEKLSRQEQMQTCHLTKAPLNFSTQQIVACPYGRLYSKEAAVEALIRRTRKQDEDGRDELGSHVRGLKDLHAARFHVEDNTNVPSCPVTGVELNGKHAAFLIPNNKRQEGPNVLSERAIKEMGIDDLQADYGPFEKQDMIQLAPPESMMEEIREAVAKKQQEEKSAKKSKKEGKKRKRTHGDKQGKKQKPRTVADAAREQVASAVASNDVLSSLFTTSQKGVVSEKERNDNLFARS